MIFFNFSSYFLFFQSILLDFSMPMFLNTEKLEECNFHIIFLFLSINFSFSFDQPSRFCTHLLFFFLRVEIFASHQKGLNLKIKNAFNNFTARKNWADSTTIFKIWISNYTQQKNASLILFNVIFYVESNSVTIMLPNSECQTDSLGT